MRLYTGLQFAGRLFVGREFRGFDVTAYLLDRIWIVAPDVELWTATDELPTWIVSPDVEFWTVMSEDLVWVAADGGRVWRAI